MTPATIIQEARVDGVRLALSPVGTIKASGDGVAVNRWLTLIREHKTGIVDVLKNGPMTAEEEKAIRAWLAHIEEIDPAIIAEVLDQCRSDADARQYFIRRAEEVPRPAAATGWVTCGDCQHFERKNHPQLGHCAEGEPEAPAGLWATDRRSCGHWEQSEHEGQHD